jgi:sulfur carrier protein ThiS adenylyltransferase
MVATTVEPVPKNKFEERYRRQLDIFPKEFNLPNQGYFEHDLGKGKCKATLEVMKYINPEGNFVGHETFVNGETFEALAEYAVFDNAVFICIDSIDGRKNIWEMANKFATHYIDGRMSAESMRILTVYDTEFSDEPATNYEKTLFAASEAQGTSCTAKSTIYCANIAAGMMISQYSKILRKFHPEPDICLNLLGNVLLVP